jgi:hypothetical protein
MAIMAVSVGQGVRLPPEEEVQALGLRQGIVSLPAQLRALEGPDRLVLLPVAGQAAALPEQTAPAPINQLQTQTPRQGAQEAKEACEGVVLLRFIPAAPEALLVQLPALS